MSGRNLPSRRRDPGTQASSRPRAQGGGRWVVVAATTSAVFSLTGAQIEMPRSVSVKLNLTAITLVAPTLLSPVAGLRGLAAAAGLAGAPTEAAGYLELGTPGAPATDRAPDDLYRKAAR